MEWLLLPWGTKFAKRRVSFLLLSAHGASFASVLRALQVAVLAMGLPQGCFQFCLVWLGGRGRCDAILIQFATGGDKEYYCFPC